MKLDLCVLDVGISDENRKKMEATFRKPNVNLIWCGFDSEEVAHLPNTWVKITRATYARLFLPGKLPQTERILYLDCDTMACRDLCELFDMNMGGNVAMGVPDVQSPYVPFGVPRWFERGRAAGDINFNAGVMLIDLVRWRAEDATKLLLEYLTDGSHLRGQDQEAINAIFGERIGLLDPRWNQQAEIFWEDHDSCYEQFLPYSQETIKQMREDPWIVHFANLPKPWHHGYEHPFVHKWFDYLDQTEFGSWRPRAPSFLKQQLRLRGKQGLNLGRKMLSRL